MLNNGSGYSYYGEDGKTDNKTREKSKRNGTKRFVWCEGSYTVEASLIMCFIICVILGIVSIGFYIHDYYVTEIAITECIKKENRFVIECSNQLDGEIDWKTWSQKSILWRLFYKNETDRLERQIETKIKGKLLLSDLEEIQTETKVGKIQLQYKLKIRFPGKWIQNILSARMLSVSNVMEIEEKESEELIRLCRSIKQ